jgi:Helix-turn-helix domain
MQVTIPEAARMLRVSEHTVRRRLRSGELQGSQVASVGGFTWMVDIPDELLIGNPASGETAVTALLIARLEAQIVSQEAQIAAQYEELEARRPEKGSTGVTCAVTAGSSCIASSQRQSFLVAQVVASQWEMKKGNLVNLLVGL